MGQSADRLWQRATERAGEATGDRARAGHRDLLADHRLDRELVAGDRAGNPPSRCLADRGPRSGSCSRCSSTAAGIRVEVEQPAGRGDGLLEVAHVVQAERGLDVAAERR